MFRCELPGEKLSKEQLDGWRSAAHAYIQKLTNAQSKEDDANAAKRLKLRRITTYEFLSCIDSVLRTLAGIGLSKFLPAESDQSLLDSSHIPPTFILTMDQCSVNWASYYYLSYHLRMRVLAWGDPFHRMWNDTKNGIRASRTWSTILITLPVLNLPHGPWNGAKWFVQIQDSLKEWMASKVGGDALWQFIYPRICHDRGELAEATMPGKEEEVLESLTLDEQFQKRGPRVTLCRWFNWFDTAVWLEERWHTRLAALLFLCIQTGAMFKEGSFEILDPLCPTWSKTDLAQGASSSSMQQSKAAGDRVRDKCANTAHYAAVVMLSSRHLQQVRMLICCMRGYRDWHGKVCAELRSPQKALEFHIECAKGGHLFPIITKAMEPLSDIKELEHIGFQVGAAALKSKKLCPDSDEVWAEDLMARRFSDIAWGLMEHRFIGMMDSVYGYPQSLALLLDTGEKDNALQTLKQDKDAQDELKTKRPAIAKKLARKSIMDTTFTKDVVAILEAAQWDLPIALEEDLKHVFSCHAQTKLIEDAVGAERALEKTKPNQACSNLSMWRHLPRKRLLTEVYGFSEVDPSSVPMPPLKKAKLPDNMFKATPQLNTVNLKGVVGTGPPEWPTRSANIQWSSAADTLFVRNMLQLGMLDSLEDCWHTCLLQKQSLVKPPGGTWMWVLANLGSQVVLWPAKETTYGKFAVYCHADACKDDVQVRPVVSWDGWVARETEMKSPLGLAAALGKHAPWPPIGATALATGKPMPLLEFAARHAFWQLKYVMLRKIAYAKLEMDTVPDNLAELILALVIKILGCPRAAAMDIIQQRAISVEELEEDKELLLSEEFESGVEQADMKDVRQYCVALEKECQEEVALGAALKQMKQHLPKTVRRAAKVPENGLISMDVARSLAPPNSLITRDQFNGRWRAWWGKGLSRLSRSMSWGARLERDIVLDLLRWQWKLHEKYEGEKCWVTGLFP